MNIYYARTSKLVSDFLSFERSLVTNSAHVACSRAGTWAAWAEVARWWGLSYDDRIYIFEIKHENLLLVLIYVCHFHHHFLLTVIQISNLLWFFIYSLSLHISFNHFWSFSVVFTYLFAIKRRLFHLISCLLALVIMIAFKSNFLKFQIYVNSILMNVRT